MKESKYFTLNEFKCKCGKCQIPEGVPSDQLIDILTDIREHFGCPVIINSGYRCPSHNARIGGAKKSQHTIGSAADIVVKGIKTKIVYDYVIRKYGKEPLGIAVKWNSTNPFGGFVHIDTRGYIARWVY